MRLPRRALALALWLHGPLAAAAEPCPDLAVRIESAWAAFDDAELAEAARELDAAIEELGCQTRLLTPAELFGLFELDALVSMGAEDEDRAVYAVIRAATAVPDRAIDPANGPDLAELYSTWRRRLSAAKVRIAVAGRPLLYLDGRPISPGSVVEVVEGEHLLQWETAAGVHSEVREITEPQTVLTSPVPAGELPSLDALSAPPAPLPAPQRDAPRRPPPGRPGIWGTGLGLAVLGGGAVVTGFLLEQRFDREAPSDAAQVRRDATTIRALYGSGYGLMGLGGVLTTVGFAVQPHADGATLVVSVPLR